MKNDDGDNVMAVTRGKKGPETVEEVGLFLGVKTKNYPSQAPRKRYPEDGFKNVMVNTPPGCLRRSGGAERRMKWQEERSFREP